MDSVRLKVVVPAPNVGIDQRVERRETAITLAGPTPHYITRSPLHFELSHQDYGMANPR